MVGVGCTFEIDILEKILYNLRVLRFEEKHLIISVTVYYLPSIFVDFCVLALIALLNHLTPNEMFGLPFKVGANFVLVTFGALLFAFGENCFATNKTIFGIGLLLLSEFYLVYTLFDSASYWFKNFLNKNKSETKPSKVYVLSPSLFENKNLLRSNEFNIIKRENNTVVRAQDNVTFNDVGNIKCSK